MGKIFFLVIVILIGAATFQFGPTITDVRTCHEVYVKESDDIGFRSRTQNYAADFVCEQNFESIGALDRCIQNAYSARAISGDLQKFVHQLFVMTRPGTKDVDVIKSHHDQECASYPGYLFQQL